MALDRRGVAVLVAATAFAIGLTTLLRGTPGYVAGAVVAAVLVGVAAVTAMRRKMVP